MLIDYLYKFWIRRQIFPLVWIMFLVVELLRTVGILNKSPSLGTNTVISLVVRGYGRAFS